MQEKGAEIVSEQQVRRELRRQRKRSEKIKSAIAVFLSSWVIVSMILIIYLVVLVFETRSQIEELKLQNNVLITSLQQIEQRLALVEKTEISESTEMVFYSDAKDYVPAMPVSSGISEKDNIADVTDVHKVYLTFEDGPSEKTAQILDVLSEKGIKATFFVTGQDTEEAQKVYKRIVEEGHTIGMHSYSNTYSTLYQSETSFKEDTTRLKAHIKSITGVEPVYYRFPGGSSNQITNVPMENLIHYLNQEGIIYFDWNVSSGDSTTSIVSADEIVANVTENVVKYKTSVVLMHDSEDTAMSADILSKVIDELLQMNVEILPIDEETAVIQSIKAADIE